MPKYILLLFCLCALSCNNNGNEKQSLANETSTPAPGASPSGPIIDEGGTLNLGMLAEFPSEVEGCSCALRMDGSGTKEYLVVYGYEGPAIMILDGKQQSLSYDLERPGQTGADVFQHRFTDDHYLLETDLVKEGQSGDEVWEYSGSIRISDQKTQSYKIIQVVGTCGC